MSEMIERVARALAKQEGYAYAPYPYDERARAAIEAMRQPTQAMLDSSWNTVIGRPPADYMATQLAEPKEAHRFKTGQRWRAMIDEALK